ncbi:MAG: TetR/AcrR family transcriptional regulator, partial [Proteobacteria bacterium]|nr:TetR/AcrR family transcriptional regulator [Pseudomonadota bacterium]
MGVRERREREREARKSAVLDAARELFLKRGFNGTTTKQIAKKCELSEATLFFYFRSKNEIFTSLLFEGIEFWARGLKKIAALDLPPREKLTRIWKFYGQVDAEHPEYYQLSAFLARPMATADVSEEVRESISRRSGENLRQLAASLED